MSSNKQPNKKAIKEQSSKRVMRPKVTAVRELSHRCTRVCGLGA